MGIQYTEVLPESHDEIQTPNKRMDTPFERQFYLKASKYLSQPNGQVMFREVWSK